MIARLAPRSWASAALATCASIPAVPTGSLDCSPIETRPAPSRAGHDAACIAASVAADTCTHVQDADTDLIVFGCESGPARAFYKALAQRSEEVGAESTFTDQTYRSTDRVLHDLFGIDLCSTVP